VVLDERASNADEQVFQLDRRIRTGKLEVRNEDCLVLDENRQVRDEDR
jgi:hypothetical protein